MAPQSNDYYTITCVCVCGGEIKISIGTQGEIG